MDPNLSATFRRRLLFNLLCPLFCLSGLALVTPCPGQVETGKSAESSQGGESDLAWSRSETYSPPNFEEFFPPDDSAGAELLEAFESSAAKRTREPDSYIEAVRRGLRSTKLHKTLVLSRLGNTFIWNKGKRQNPKAIELMYHATGSDNHEVVHYSMYFGLTVVENRTPNLIRTLMTNHKRYGEDIQRRILWGFKTYGDQGNTLQLISDLLDDHESLDEDAIIAACEYYRELSGKEPPNADRFSRLGKWVIGISHDDIGSDIEDGPQQLRDILGQSLEIDNRDLLQYVGRVDGRRWVGVALVAGLKFKQDLVATVEQQEEFHLEFADPLNERLFQKRRLQELLDHFEGEVTGVRPKYSLPDISEVFSWNRTDKYVSPSFGQFFPSDRQASAKLDELIQSKSDWSEHTDRAYLELFRNGLRESQLAPNQLFGTLAFALGWPEDPYQSEVLFHAIASDAPESVRKSALYYWLGFRGPKSENMLRHFAELICGETNIRNSPHGKIIWSLANNEDDKQKLAKYLEVQLLADESTLDSSQLANLMRIHKELTGDYPAVPQKLFDRCLFVVLWTREGIETKDAMVRYQQRLDHPFVEEQEIQQFGFAKGKSIVGVALLRGPSAFDWIVNRLDADKTNSIGFASPYPAPWDLRNGMPTADDVEILFMRPK